MALHEQSVGATDEWYTPAYIFEAMGVEFDFDPCPPGGRNGLVTPWSGFVWMNPPFGARNGIVPWLEKFFAHGDGVALVPDRTSAPWWQQFVPQADLVLFVSPKIRFIGANGEPGRSPAQGTCLLAAGQRGRDALWNAYDAGLGKLFRPC